MAVRVSVFATGSPATASEHQPATTAAAVAHHRRLTWGPGVADPTADATEHRRVVASHPPSAQSACVVKLASKTVLPLHAQVALVDATWQDYPQWETGDERVAYKAPPLIHADDPPNPGGSPLRRARTSTEAPSSTSTSSYGRVSVLRTSG